MGAPEHRFEHGKHMPRKDRLSQQRSCAGVDRSTCEIHIVAPSHHDDGDLQSIRSQSGQHFEPGESWHCVIENHAVRSLNAKRFQKGNTRVEQVDAITGRA